MREQGRVSERCKYIGRGRGRGRGGERSVPGRWTDRTGQVPQHTESRTNSQTPYMPRQNTPECKRNLVGLIALDGEAEKIKNVDTHVYSRPLTHSVYIHPLCLDRTALQFLKRAGISRCSCEAHWLAGEGARVRGCSRNPGFTFAPIISWKQSSGVNLQYQQPAVLERRNCPCCPCQI